VNFQEMEACCDEKKYDKKEQEDGRNGHDHYMAVADLDFARYFGFFDDANPFEHYNSKPIDS
jgi:hypothetical protein